MPWKAAKERKTPLEHLEVNSVYEAIQSSSVYHRIYILPILLIWYLYVIKKQPQLVLGRVAEYTFDLSF